MSSSSNEKDSPVNPVRIVEVQRNPSGFGFTLSSQAPCILSCVVAGGPADKAGLQPGDQVIEVNGKNVERASHEFVVKMIARSHESVVRMSIRSIAASTTSYSEGSSLIDDEDDEKTIQLLHRVDKVVEELRSGQLFNDSPLLKNSFINGPGSSILGSELDLASDEELRESFSETLRSQGTITPSPGYSTSRRSSFDRLRNGAQSPCISRMLYPSLTPVNPPSLIEDEQDVEPDLRTVVGYLGSIEIPSSSTLHTPCLNSVKGCVRRLRLQQKVHSQVLMEVSIIGVKLINPQGRTIVTYPIRSLAFTGVCADDKRFFSLVTRKMCETVHSHSDSMHSLPNYLNDNEEFTINYSCHVFMADSELTSHNIHINTADRFGIVCTTTDGGKCREFLHSSTPIIQAISGLFVERVEGRPHSRAASSRGSVHPVPDVACIKLDERFLTESTHSNASVSSSDSQNVQSDTLLSDEVFTRDRNYFNHRDRRNMYITQQNDVQTHKIEQALEEAIATCPEFIFPVETFPGNDVNKMQGAMQDASPNLCDRNDSGISSEPAEMNEIRPNRPVGPPPSVSVTYHSRENSLESYNSMDSHANSMVYDSRLKSDLRRNRSASESGIMDERKNVKGWLDVDFGFGDDRPNLSNLKSRPSMTSTHSMPTACDSVEGRVAQWAVSFDKLLQDPAGLRCFQEFLKKEFSQENIVFWIECEKFCHLADPEELRVSAKNIYQSHLAPRAAMPVNVDNHATKDAEEQLQNPNSDMFSLQQQQIYTLMKFDSFPRFKKSDLYRQCLLAEMEGLSLPFEEDKDDDKNFVVPHEHHEKHKRIMFPRTWSRKQNNKKVQNCDEEEDRRRSLLPWKGKGRHDSRKKGLGSQPSSTNSSMSSLSDGLGHNVSQSFESLAIESSRSEPDVRGSFQFCRVVMPDRSSTVLVAKPGQTLKQSLVHLCERRQLSLPSSEVFINSKEKAATAEDLEVDMSTMGSKQVILELRILFRVELPNGRVMGMKAKPSQCIKEVMGPVLSKNGYSLNNLVVHLVDCEVPLDFEVPVASLEHQHIIIETEEDFIGRGNSDNIARLAGKPPTGLNKSSMKLKPDKQQSMGEAVFDEIMRSKRQSMDGGYFDEDGAWVYPGIRKSRSDESLLNGRRSSDGSAGKGILKLNGKKRKQFNESKSKKKTTRFEADEMEEQREQDFLAMVNASQKGRLNDQRGTLSKGTLELPDFLKLPSQGTTRNQMNHSYAGQVSDNNRHYQKQINNSYTSDISNQRPRLYHKPFSLPELGVDKDLARELEAKLASSEEGSSRRDSTSSVNSLPTPVAFSTPSVVDGKGGTLTELNASATSLNFDNPSIYSVEVRSLENSPEDRDCHVSVKPLHEANGGIPGKTAHDGGALTSRAPAAKVKYHYDETRVPPAGNHVRSVPAQSHVQQDFSKYKGRPLANHEGDTSVQEEAHGRSTPVIYDMQPTRTSGGIREAMASMEKRVHPDSAQERRTPVASTKHTDFNPDKAEIIISDNSRLNSRGNFTNMYQRRARAKPITDSLDLMASLESSPHRSQTPPLPSVPIQTRNIKPPLPPSQLIHREHDLPPPPSPPGSPLDELEMPDFSPPDSVCNSPDNRASLSPSPPPRPPLPLEYLNKTPTNASSKVSHLNNRTPQHFSSEDLDRTLTPGEATSSKDVQDKSRHRHDRPAQRRGQRGHSSDLKTFLEREGYENVQVTFV